MKFLVVIIPCVALCAACVPYEAARLPEAGRFEALMRRDLSAYEQRLASERQVGQADGWTSVGYAWIALASCTPVEAHAVAPDAAVEARAVYATLKLEQVRRQRLLVMRGAGLVELSITGTMFERLDDEGFFVRAPSDKRDEWRVVWPHGEEAWADELPAALKVETRCAAYYREEMKRGADEARRQKDDGIVQWRPVVDEAQAAAGPPKPGSLAWLQGEELRLVEEALGLLAQSAQGPGVEALTWRLMFHRATMVWRMALVERQIAGTGALVLGLGERQRMYLEAACGWMAPLGAREVAGGGWGVGVEVSARAKAALYHGMCEEAAGRLSEARRAYDAARGLGLEGADQDVADYAALRVLTRLGEWEEAARFEERLPAPGSALYSAAVYRVGVALRRTGQQDRLLALSLRAFRDKAYRPDPFMRALYLQTLRQLVAYPFTERTVEVIEDLGPRDRIFERVEEYARVALDMGEPENARAAARWLLSKHWQSSYAPRYYAILALAAFLDDDVADFEVQAREIVRRDAQVEEAVGALRSPGFFAGADAELARLLRQMLPVMAEWGEGPGAEARRQRWLKVIVEMAQRFVRETPETLARPSLVELYRLASAMLEVEQARAYPERVGQLGPGPLVLGTVRVEDRDLEAFEPDVASVEAPLMWSLTLVPQDGVGVEAWPMFWAEAEQGEEEAR